ncbi:MAG: hypothetical protein KA007_01230 [Candidatus Pacebacteria bacterium]|nr:hypothetical protein [Candidatus Paceibacterota bacterium]
MQKFLKNINFTDLRQQKATLVEMSAKSKGKEREALDAIIGLVDSLQDTAVDRYGYEEEEVFNLSKED